MHRHQLVFSLSVIFIVTSSVQGDKKFAECKIMPDSGVGTENIQGKVTFEQEKGKDITIKVDLSGFDTTDDNTDHGFHVHREGKLGNQCSDALDHYNPYKMDHGGPTDDVRHVGDLGNIKEDCHGNVKTTITDSIVKLYGHTSVLGRSIVVHADPDDLGRGGTPDSKTTGNAGPRIGCCVITEV